MRISGAARNVGCSPDWILKAERTGLIPPAPRDLNGDRRYTPELVEIIRSVFFGKHDLVLTESLQAEKPGQDTTLHS